MIYNEEEKALMLFIEARPNGNMLRDIAERRLCDITNSQAKRIDPIHVKVRDPAEYYNKYTGDKYVSILQAAKNMGLTYNQLHHDIYREKFNKGVVPIYKSTLL